MLARDATGEGRAAVSGHHCKQKILFTDFRSASAHNPHALPRHLRHSTTFSRVLHSCQASSRSLFAAETDFAHRESFPTMSPRKSHASSTLGSKAYHLVEKDSRFKPVGVYPHDSFVSYHNVAKNKRSRRKAGSSQSSPRTPHASHTDAANPNESPNAELRRLLPRQLNLHVGDSCNSPAKRPAYCCGFFTPKFSWPEAFATAGDTALVIFDHLPLPTLANIQRVCKGFRRMIANSPLLSHKLATPGAEFFVEVYKLEDRMPLAPAPGAWSPFKKTLQGSYRKILVDWLVDVQSEYNLSSETLHQAIILVDRCFAAKTDLPTNKIQLLGATCLFIASKFTEIEGPTLLDMVWVCDNCYTKDEHTRMETLVLSILEFRLRCVTPAEYIRCFCNTFAHAKDTESLAMYYADLYMLESNAIGARPLLIAAAAFALALHTQAFPIPMDQISFLAKSSVRSVRVMVCQMQSLHLVDFNGMQNSGATPANNRQPLRACKERYSSHKGLQVFIRYPPRDPQVLVSGVSKLHGDMRCSWCLGHSCAYQLMSSWRCALTSTSHLAQPVTYGLCAGRTF